MKPPTLKDKTSRNLSQSLGLIVGLVAFFLILLFFDFNPDNPSTTRMAAIAALMAIWWITDAIPLYTTALIPLILYPLMGILKGSEVAPIYINSTIFLFIGGFMIAIAMEFWGLHRRIALFIINRVGGSSSHIIMGFMIAGAFLSMWISNTATAIMMVPIGLAIISQMESRFPISDTNNFSTGLMLAIAYACSIGGIATLVGTPPNLSFSRIFEIIFPEAEPITFGTWFLMGLPLSIIMLTIVWFLITKIVYRVPKHVTVDHSIIKDELNQLGKPSFEERVVLTLFILTALLWVFRKPLELGIISIPGWSSLLPFPSFIDDGTIALTMALLMFLIPSRSGKEKSASIMPSNTVKRLPWSIILLFGGGFALAKGFQISDLSEVIGTQFSGLAGISLLLLILIICATITFLTELTSNTATTEMILPILASVAITLQINPLLLMIPATLAASFAFMMPVATPPNAIIFGSERISISQMSRIGVFINIIGVLVLAIGFYLIGTTIFGIDVNTFPEWANNN